MCNKTAFFLISEKPAGGRNLYELSNATVVHNTPYTTYWCTEPPWWRNVLIITLIQLNNLDSDRAVMHGCDSFSRFHAFFLLLLSSSAGKAEINRAETKTFFRLFCATSYNLQQAK
jgi:hypothetical protein